MNKVILALALGASAAGAQAGQLPPPRPAPDGAATMMRADTNGDGVITRAEAIADADARFAQIDANHDGFASADEMRAYRDALRDRMIASGGTPPPRDRQAAGGPRRGEGNTRPSVSRADYEGRAVQRFDRMDANHDGSIDRTEMASMAAMRRERRGEGMTPPTPAAPPEQ